MARGLSTPEAARVSANRRRTLRHNSKPSLFGMVQSLTMMRTASVVCSTSQADLPSATSTASCPKRRRACRNTARATGSSSTVRIFTLAVVIWPPSFGNEENPSSRLR